MASTKNGTNKPMFSERRVEIGTVVWSDLIIDPSIQRGQEWSEINAIAGDFNADALGTLTVSVRTNGDKVLLDGQQRMNAAQIAGHTEPVSASLHYGLTHKEEAALFRRLNYKRSVGAAHLFRVACTEGVPQALATRDVLNKYGITIGGPGGFNAIAAARRIVEAPGGLRAFEWALDIVNQVWGASGKHLDGRIIEGLALWYGRDFDDIDIDSLRQKLAVRKGGLHGVIGDAKTVQSLRKGKLVTAVVEVLLAEYNKGRKKSMLPDWQR